MGILDNKKYSVILKRAGELPHTMSRTWLVRDSACDFIMNELMTRECVSGALITQTLNGELLDCHECIVPELISGWQESKALNV